MSPRDTLSKHRRQALLFGIAGVLLLLVAVIGRSLDLRGVLSGISGVLFLVLGVQQLKKAGRS